MTGKHKVLRRAVFIGLVALLLFTSIVPTVLAVADHPAAFSSDSVADASSSQSDAASSSSSSSSTSSQPARGFLRILYAPGVGGWVLIIGVILLAVIALIASKL